MQRSHDYGGKNADLFASVLLLPREGVYAMLSTNEILQHDVKLATILRIEQLFQVSRSMLLIRLKDIGVISENKRQELQMIPVKESAMNYGCDKSLYESGNDGVLSEISEKKPDCFSKRERFPKGIIRNC